MLIRLYEKNTSQRDLDRVLDILNGGGVIVFPTDTAYALGCHALKERPIERICKIKGMNPQKHRFSIVCYDLSDISQYVQIDLQDNETQPARPVHFRAEGRKPSA